MKFVIDMLCCPGFSLSIQSFSTFTIQAFSNSPGYGDGFLLGLFPETYIHSKRLFLIYV